MPTAVRKLPPDWMLTPCLVVALGLWIHGSFPLTTGDLFHTQFAAYQWHAGTPQAIYTTYEPAAQARWLTEWKVVAARLGADDMPYAHFYPPFFAAALAPVADVPAVWWRNAMFAVNVVMLLLLAGQMVLLANGSLNLRMGLWALALVLAANAVATTISYGQISLLTAVLMWAGLLRIRRSDGWSGGIMIGLAASLKLSPVSILLYPAFCHKWKAVTAGVFALAALFVISPLLLGAGIFQIWWSSLQYVGHYVFTDGLDQSISAWFTRGVLGYSMGAAGFPATPVITGLRWACAVLFAGTSVALLWSRRRALTDSDFPAAVGVLMCGTMLSLPFMWNYYLVLPLPVLGWALFESWQTGGHRFLNVWLTIAALFFCIRMYPLYDNTPTGRFFGGSHTIGLLMLWGWLIHRVAAANGLPSRDFESAMKSQPDLSVA